MSNYETQIDFQGSYFTFTAYKCECLKEVTYNDFKEEVFTFKINTRYNEPIKYAFNPKDGMVVIRKDNGAIDVSYNIIPDLLALKLDDNAQDADELVRFIEKYGFLFNITGQKNFRISYLNLASILKRLQILNELRNIVQVDKEQYRIMLRNIIWLNLNEEITILDNDNSILFSTLIHPVYKLLFNKKKTPFIDLPVYYGDSYDFDDRYYNYYDTFQQKEGMMFEKVYCDALEQFEYEDLLQKDDIDLYTAYYTSINVPCEDRYLIDFIVNFLSCLDYDSLDLPWVFYEEGYKCALDWLISEKDSEFEIKLTDDYKEFLVKIAKQTIKEEFDYIIKSIHPIYNIETMGPEWKIDDMMTAIYFSFFYMNPQYELYRKCQRPSCNIHFIVSSTNKKRKYCSDICRNADAQMRYRLNHPEKIGNHRKK